MLKHSCSIKVYFWIILFHFEQQVKTYYFFLFTTVDLIIMIPLFYCDYILNIKMYL